MLLVWVFVFLVSLFVLVKSADWFLHGAEEVGKWLGLSPFIIGVTVVGIGTSLPELVSAIAAVMDDVPEIVIASAVGSNISNILFVIGIAAIVGRDVKATKNLIDLDLPLLAVSTALFLLFVVDGGVTRPEALILVAAYGIYLLYTILEKEEGEEELDRETRRELRRGRSLYTRDVLLLLVGMVGLALAATSLVESIVLISEALAVSPGIISVTAVGFGTSLPEVSIVLSAARKNKMAIIFGNVLGSNIFNTLMVVGIPGLITTLPISGQTHAIALPAMIVATLLLVFSGISGKVHRWDGALYVLVYIAFLGTLFGVL